MKKQYTITERNSWEQETFGYVMYLTPEQADTIKNKISAIGILGLKIEESNYTDEDIQRICKNSTNGYMDRIGKYYFESDSILDEWEQQGDLFYKGNGLLTQKEFELKQK